MKNKTTKRNWTLGLLVGMVMLLGAAPAMAGYYLIDTIYGNDAGGPLYVGSAMYNQTAKIDFSDNFAGTASTTTGGINFNVTVDSGSHSGSWTTTYNSDGSNAFVVDLFVVKAGTHYNVYGLDVNGIDYTASWVTPTYLQNNKLKTPAISHISFYDTMGGGGQNVPIPGAVWLLGSGLSALLIARRKQK